jgi:rSAM/selenodomain-associated transferase 1
MTQTRIIIFAKVPLAGFVKTRLIPALGAQGAADLALRMLDSTLMAACDADIGPVELCVSPAIEDACWHEIALPSRVFTSSQGVGDLGQRLARAAQRALQHNEALLLIGTDCVEMSPALLQAAAAHLQNHDALIHPTADGGYALLGLRQYDPSLFSDIPWSSNNVASQTMQRIQNLGWHCFCGATLRDIDEPADLAHLPPHWILESDV